MLFQDILRFLLQLRALLRGTEACCIISFSPNLSSASYETHWIQKVTYMSDGCITLQGITSDPTLAPSFPSYSGLLNVHSTPSPHTLWNPSKRFSQLRGLNVATSTGAGGGGENNLAFKCMRKRFVVETLHLDVEGGVGERRTAPVTGTSSISTSQIPTSLETHSHVSAKVAIEGPVGLDDKASVVVPKKPKKKVAFHSGDYDF